MKDKREFPDYLACDKCGYTKYCKLTPIGFICRSCARIEKEKENDNPDK